MAAPCLLVPLAMATACPWLTPRAWFASTAPVGCRGQMPLKKGFSPSETSVAVLCKWILSIHSQKEFSARGQGNPLVSAVFALGVLCLAALSWTPGITDPWNWKTGNCHCTRGQSSFWFIRTLCPVALCLSNLAELTSAAGEALICVLAQVLRTKTAPSNSWLHTQSLYEQLSSSLLSWLLWLLINYVPHTETGLQINFLLNNCASQKGPPIKHSDLCLALTGNSPVLQLPGQTPAAGLPVQGHMALIGTATELTLSYCCLPSTSTETTTAF